jgi:hypothetical protein
MFYSGFSFFLAWEDGRRHYRSALNQLSDTLDNDLRTQPTGTNAGLGVNPQIQVFVNAP